MSNRKVTISDLKVSFIESFVSFIDGVSFIGGSAVCPSPPHWGGIVEPQVHTFPLVDQDRRSPSLGRHR